MPTRQVTVVRHGQTGWSATGRHTGRTDVELTQDGEDEARRAGRLLRDERFHRVWTSPLHRASRTCELAGYGAVASVHDDLVEWDYGRHEGRTRAEITADEPGWDVWTFGARGGESVDDMQRRVDGVVARLLDASGDTLIFAHGHLLRALAAAWIELPITEGRRFPLDTAAIGVLGWYHERRALVRWNLRSGPFDTSA